MLPCWKSGPSITRIHLKSGILLQVRDYESPGLAEIKKIRKKQFYLIKSTFVLCFGRGKCCHDEWKCAIKMILFKNGKFFPVKIASETPQSHWSIFQCKPPSLFHGVSHPLHGDLAVPWPWQSYAQGHVTLPRPFSGMKATEPCVCPGPRRCTHGPFNAQGGLHIQTVL